jgi:hypothetical protein
MSSEELMTEKVKVFYDGAEFLVPKGATEDQIRVKLQEAAEDPAVANARFSQDEETGDWTVTREAGQKGL